MSERRSDDQPSNDLLKDAIADDKRRRDEADQIKLAAKLKELEEKNKKNK